MVYFDEYLVSCKLEYTSRFLKSKGCGRKNKQSIKTSIVKTVEFNINKCI